MNKAYIGDSVYVEIDQFGEVVLTTENGYPDDPRNRIVMESSVLQQFEEYIERARALAKGEGT